MHLLSWLARRGARFAPLAIRPDPVSGRTVVAAVPLAAGAVLMHIPRRFLVTVAEARASAVGRAILASGAGPFGDQTFLAAHLLQERTLPRSRLRAYIDALPASFPGLPLFFGARKLALLRGSALLARIAARKEALRREHRCLRGAVPALRARSFGAFAWAHACVFTRVFGVAIAGQETEALVPGGDMLDHREPPEARWAYEDDASAFVVIAERDLRAGERIHASYGKKSDARFYLNYGFITGGNDGDNEAAVRLAVHPEAARAGVKASLLGTAPGEIRTFPLAASPDDARSVAALSFLRMACATPREGVALASTSGFDPARLPALGGRNESAALRALSAACAEALRAFPTTADEDEALLAAPRLSQGTRDAVAVRLGEKQVLEGWLALARAAAPLLASARAAPRPRAGRGRRRRRRGQPLPGRRRRRGRGEARGAGRAALIFRSARGAARARCRRARAGRACTGRGGRGWRLLLPRPCAPPCARRRTCTRAARW